MTLDVLFWSYLVSALVGLVLLYVVVRLAIVHGLKSVEVWKAGGGVQQVLDAETFSRTGIRPPSE